MSSSKDRGVLDTIKANRDRISRAERWELQDVVSYLSALEPTLVDEALEYVTGSEK